MQNTKKYARRESNPNPKAVSQQSFLADHFCPDVTKPEVWLGEGIMLPHKSGKWERQESNLPRTKEKETIFVSLSPLPK